MAQFISALGMATEPTKPTEPTEPTPVATPAERTAELIEVLRQLRRRRNTMVYVGSYGIPRGVLVRYPLLTVLVKHFEGCPDLMAVHTDPTKTYEDRLLSGLLQDLITYEVSILSTQLTNMLMYGRSTFIDTFKEPGYRWIPKLAEELGLELGRRIFDNSWELRRDRDVAYGWKFSV